MIIPPELGALLSAFGGAAMRELVGALARAIQRRKLRPMQEVDDMADSARFAAIEESISRLTLQLDAQKLEAARRIEELTNDLHRATQHSARLAHAVEHLYDELQSLRRDTGLPELPPLETYLQETRTHDPGTSLDPGRPRAAGDRLSGTVPRALPAPWLRPPR